MASPELDDRTDKFYFANSILYPVSHLLGEPRLPSDAYRLSALAVGLKESESVSASIDMYRGSL